MLDVLTGAVNPCGKLTDTIAENIEDYPSTKNFGSEKRNVYQEDIYIGYRYFETFAKAQLSAGMLIQSGTGRTFISTGGT